MGTNFLVAIAAAVMLTTIVVFTVVVVIAADVGIVTEVACQQVFHCGIRITEATAVQCDACLLEGCLCATADATADQHIYIQGFQHTGQSAMTAAVAVYDLGCDNITVFHFINLKLLGVTEVLEDHTVSISNCDFHDMFAPFD